jgi:hypothetical protein
MEYYAFIKTDQTPPSFYAGLSSFKIILPFEGIILNMSFVKKISLSSEWKIIYPSSEKFYTKSNALFI